LGQGDLNLFMKWPGSQMSPARRAKKGFFFFRKSSDEPVDQMQNYLAWIIPMTC